MRSRRCTVDDVCQDRQCDGKIRFRDYQTAHHHKRSLGYKGVDIYRCPRCGYLHLGHSRGKRVYKRARQIWALWI